MVNHEAIQLACRARALTLVVCTTGSMTLAATGSTYTRSTGSFITDGFRLGMEVTPSGFTDTTRRVVTNVEALTLTVDSAPTAQVAASGRTLTVGLPQTVILENGIITPPTNGVPYAVEQYLPGGLERITMGAFGMIEATPLYLLDFYGVKSAGMSALAKYADKTIEHFAPTTPLVLSTGDTAVVRGQPGPTRSQLAAIHTGQPVMRVTIPLRCRTANSR